MLAAIGAWFASLITGHYPRGLFAYIEGVIRWHARVLSYAILLLSDRYPPFRLGAEPSTRARSPKSSSNSARDGRRPRSRG